MPTEISGSTGVNKITDGTIVNADIASGSTITANVPVFKARLTSNQTVTQNVWTKVAMSNERFDSNSWYDTSTYRYTPLIEGYYQFHGQMMCGTGSLTAAFNSFYKNGSIHSAAGLYADNNSWDDMGITHTDIIYMNGSSDYVEMFVKVVDTGASTDIVFYEISGADASFLTGHLIREGS